MYAPKGKGKTSGTIESVVHDYMGSYLENLLHIGMSPWKPNSLQGCTQEILSRGMHVHIVCMCKLISK